MSFKTQQIKVNEISPDNVLDYLVHGCEHAAKLANCVTYSIRQAHFEKCPRTEYFDANGMMRSGFKMKSVSVSYAKLCEEFKSNSHYKALGGQQAQQVIKSVVESFRSYNKLIPLWFEGELNGRPQMPGYRSKGALASFSIPNQGVTLNIEDGTARIPLSMECKSDFKEIGDILTLPSANGFKASQLSEIRILPRNGALYAEYVYEDDSPSWPSCNLSLDHTKALGVDHGLDNWLTCVSSEGKSFIVDGRKVKSLNQLYNKQVATIKEGKPQGYWDEGLAFITEKRNRQMRDAINKAARLVVNNCLENGYGVLVFGWGDGIKTSINLGSKTNQEFVLIPTSRLKDRIEQLCIEYGIEFIETEESYTSKTSFLDGDFLPTRGEKPASWKPSGKRGKRVKGKLNNLGRGGYLTAKGWKINADCNGAVNILRKVTTQLDLNLAKVARGALTLPQRYDPFKSLKKSYRERAVARLQTA